MQCRTHPTTSAYNTCNQCGDWLCEECTVDIQGRLFCRTCLMKMAAPGSAPYSVPPLPPGVMPAKKRVSGGLLFLFSFFFPPGINYMFMGLIKRGLAALIGFFLIIYFINVSNMPLTLLFGLALPVYFLTCIFDGFNIRRRINAGEAVGDNIDGVILFLKNNQIICWVLLALVGFSVLGSVMGIFIRLIRWLMPLVIIGLGMYLLFRHKNPPGPPSA